MMQYLVIARFVMDDVPVAIFSHYDDAKKFASAIPLDVLNSAIETMQVDSSLFCCIAILHFRNGLSEHLELTNHDTPPGFFDAGDVEEEPTSAD